jgi:hypothetical protein
MAKLESREPGGGGGGRRHRGPGIVAARVWKISAPTFVAVWRGLPTVPRVPGAGTPSNSGTSGRVLSAEACGRGSSPPWSGGDRSDPGGRVRGRGTYRIVSEVDAFLGGGSLGRFTAEMSVWNPTEGFLPFFL